MPKKKYLVTLTDDERTQLEQLLRGGKAATRKVTRARILLKASEGWPDQRIAEALSIGRATVERTRQRFVEENLAEHQEEWHNRQSKTKIPVPELLPPVHHQLHLFVVAKRLIRDLIVPMTMNSSGIRDIARSTLRSALIRS